eukprot:gnl/MRDRNA2_/MRDRNA2_144414_c0_seq1.p1 gnl/MRDRNA2_/MRDRNA2_144414_c0~~gnl/MRDRNA2_/MRDRNA2_144414_c0_seq1.p1  ORF type:complete len:675 (-),score=80.14 gnl/MRDRNA2_/MRDRNA2_144414_c0_seq1:173-2197(-)
MMHRPDERSRVVLMLHVDGEETGTALYLAHAASLHLGGRSSGAEVPAIVILRVEGLTTEVCDAGMIEAQLGTSKMGQEFADETSFVAKGRVSVSTSRSQSFSPFVYPMLGPGRERNADAVQQNDAEGVNVYIYDRSTVKNNLITTINYAVNFLQYDVVGVCGSVGNMHTLNRLVSSLKSTSAIPVTLSPVMMLRSLQFFCPDDSRILLLTFSREVFEDYYDQMIPSSLEVERSRLKIVGTQEILAEAGLIEADAVTRGFAIAEVCQRISDECENSSLRLRGVLIVDNRAVQYQEALHAGLPKIPIYSMINMIELMCSGVSSRIRSREEGRSGMSKEGSRYPPKRMLAKQSLMKSSSPVGIIRLDGANYAFKTARPGDVANAQSFVYDVIYLRVEGFSFECCQTGPKEKSPNEWYFPDSVIVVPRHLGSEGHLFYSSDTCGVPRKADEVIENQEGTTYIYHGETVFRNVAQVVMDMLGQGVVCISSACGFMINMNRMVRNFQQVMHSRIPIVLSSLGILSIIHQMTSNHSRIAILTSNSERFNDHYERLVPKYMHFRRTRLKIIGLEGVDGFGAEVASGMTVDAEKTASSIVGIVQATMDKYAGSHLQIRAVLVECTELPGYCGELRVRLHPRIPVYDSISLVDFLQAGVGSSSPQFPSSRQSPASPQSLQLARL